MNDMPPCNLCHGREYKLLYRGNIVDDMSPRFSQYAYYDDIYRCCSCGLVVQQCRHSREAIARFLKAEKYLDEAIGGLNLIEKYVQFEHLIRLIEKYRPIAGSKLLDVGANTGVFLSTVRSRAAAVRGIEPSEEAAQIARTKLGVDVQAGLIGEVELPDAAFDLITMFDVVEHLTDPADDLAHLFRKLAPGGAIFITTHDIETWFARLSGPRYPMLMYQHFFHFSPATLLRMLEQAGFRVLGYDRFLKSWSFEYLYHLIEKKWPGTRLAWTLRMLLSPGMAVPAIRKARITSPQRDFFMIAAERRR